MFHVKSKCGALLSAYNNALTFSF